MGAHGRWTTDKRGICHGILGISGEARSAERGGARYMYSHWHTGTQSRQQSDSDSDIISTISRCITWCGGALGLSLYQFV